MKKILLISFYLIAYTCMNNLAVKCHSLSYEEQIRNEISNSNYSIKMRPSLPTTIHVKILFGQIGEKKKSYFKYIIAKLLFLSQFLYYYVEVILDELKQIITTSSNLFVDWFDQRLAWLTLLRFQPILLLLTQKMTQRPETRQLTETHRVGPSRPKM